MSTINNQQAPKLNILTEAQLRAILIANDRNTSELVQILNELRAKYQLSDKLVFAHYLANALHESGEFTSLQENMNYSAQRLTQVWPSRFKTIKDAEPYARNAEKLANYVYANRMGNGDSASGDGWKYRGGGVMQLTGKDMYKAYADYIGKPIDDTAQLVRKDLKTAIDSSMWLFAINKKLIPIALQNDVVTLRKRINGGMLGIADVRMYLKTINDVLK